MLTLGIETSCDDTAVALVEDGRVLSSIVSSQHAVHAPYGGVVPELAARAHLENLPTVLDAALTEAGRRLAEVDLIAVTSGPGLQIALLVGLAEAKGLAVGLGKPLVAVNHLRAHLHATRMAEPTLEPPYLGLLVSGGHTSLVLVGEDGGIEELGRTRDDAAGECFDKVARVAGFEAPGGPAVSKRAMGGDPTSHRFSRSRVKGAPLDFSFSGLKTAAVRLREEGTLSDADFCAAFEGAIADELVHRVEGGLDYLAGEGRSPRAVTVAGGVAANRVLRSRLADTCRARGVPFFATPPRLCTDNAAMIAGLGAWEYARTGAAHGLSASAEPGLGFRLPGTGTGTGAST